MGGPRGLDRVERPGWTIRPPTPRLRFGAMRIRLLLLVALIGLALSCGGDDAGLTDAERAWCTLDDRTDESALRFDLIFEAGLELELPMDALNATAARLFDEYVADGLDEDAAVLAVSGDLLDDPDYRTACRRAYAQELGTGQG